MRNLMICSLTHYRAGDKIERNKIGGACSAYGGGGGVYRVLVGKPEEKSPQGRPRCRWKDNIKADFDKVGYGGFNWIELAQDRDR
jgi:hypothetical protein